MPDFSVANFRKTFEFTEKTKERDEQSLIGNWSKIFFHEQCKCNGDIY